ncbi:hypothetical protein ABPG75_000476 [Micractinium tetrahymenae]
MAAAEPKWAKGVSSSTRGDAWSMAFQIRGKRHALSLRGSQAEAAVAYDLTGCWAHKEKGNDALRCSSYNFPLAFYPPPLLGQLLSGALGGWEGVKAFVARLAAAGALKQLVPFEGAGRRFRIADAEAWRPQPDSEVCFNLRGVHFFRGSSWICVPMDDVQSFGSSGRFLQLTYVSGPVGRPGRSAIAHTFCCANAGAARGELQAVADQRRQAGLAAPRDLGDRIVLPQGAALAAADFDVFGEAGEEAEHGSAAAAGASPSDCGSLGDEEPSQEELELFTQFADLARSLSRGSDAAQPSGAGSGAGSGGSSVDQAAVPAAASASAGGAACPAGTPSSRQQEERLPQQPREQQQQQHGGPEEASQRSGSPAAAAALVVAQDASLSAGAAAAAAAAAAVDNAAQGALSSPSSSRSSQPQAAEAAMVSSLAGNIGKQGQQGRKRPAPEGETGSNVHGQASPAAKRQHTEPVATATAASSAPAAAPAAAQRRAPPAGVPVVPFCGVRPLGAVPMLPAMLALLQQQQEAALKAAAAAAKAGGAAALGAPGAGAGAAAPAAAPGFRPVAMLPMPMVLPAAMQKQALAAMQVHAARLQAAAAATGAKHGTAAAASAAAGTSQGAAGRGRPLMVPMQQFMVVAAAAQQKLLQRHKQAQAHAQPEVAR